MTTAAPASGAAYNNTSQQQQGTKATETERLLRENLDKHEEQTRSLTAELASLRELIAKEKEGR